MKILVICGGGVFGIIPAYLLNHANGRKLTKWDAFGGTSVGAELIIGYSYGRTPQFVLDVFQNSFDKIFSRPWYSKFNPWGPKYPDHELNKALKTIVPENVRFMDLLTPVIIPTYDFKHGKPKIFDNIVDYDDNLIAAWQIARASSSAPTYFAPFGDYIDGGIVANNATVVTAWALHNKMNIPYSEMEIFTLGTGYKERDVLNMDSVKSWSPMGWLNPMIDMLTLGNEQMWNFGANQMGLKKYKYFNEVKLDDDWEIDDPSIVPELIQRCQLVTDDFKEIYGEF